MAHEPDKHQPDQRYSLDVSDEESLEADLTAALYRQDCPETMLLGDYQMGLLAANEADPVAAHVARCPHCQAELARLAEFIGDEGSAEAWQPGEGFAWRQAQETGQIIIKFGAEAVAAIRQKLAEGLQPPAADPLAFGGVRSGGASRVYEWNFNEGVADFEAIITLETDWQAPEQCDVVVDVNIPSRGGWPKLADIEVVLKEAERVIATQTTNPFGQAVFKQIPTAQLNRLRFEIGP